MPYEQYTKVVDEVNGPIWLRITDLQEVYPLPFILKLDKLHAPVWYGFFQKVGEGNKGMRIEYLFRPANERRADNMYAFLRGIFEPDERGGFCWSYINRNKKKFGFRFDAMMDNSEKYSEGELSFLARRYRKAI